MVDVYTDRDPMFTLPRRKEKASRSGRPRMLTHSGRSLRALGIGSIMANSPQAKAAGTQFSDRAGSSVNPLRLAKVCTLEAADLFLEKEYWPDWTNVCAPGERFPRPPSPLDRSTGSGRDLCHAEQRVIGTLTFSFSGQRYQIQREHVQAGMRHQRLRVECGGWEVEGSYQARYLSIEECGDGVYAPSPAASRRAPWRDQNAGGKSAWIRASLTVPRLRRGMRSATR